MIFSLAVAALAAGLGAYEYRTWEVSPDGGSHTIVYDGLRKLTNLLFRYPGIVLSPSIWLAVPLYAVLCGAGAGAGMYVCGRLSAKGFWPYIAGTVCAVLVAILTTVTFQVIWDRFISNPPP